MSTLDADGTARFFAGTHRRLHDFLGAHLVVRNGVAGTSFSVWAPHARSVSVIGDWNRWDGRATPMEKSEPSGIWSAFAPRVGKGARYKFHIEGADGAYRVDKADPFALYGQEPPDTASIVWDLAYAWGDGDWMARRKERSARDAPMSIYEVHVGSWRLRGDDRPLGFRALAPLLADHVRDAGFTHVELMPVMAHPYLPSWGYQATGYFAPTSRWGTPQDLMDFIDHLHQQGIGVILDWVPSHFPSDAAALSYFDGTYLFEHGDPRRGFHPDWQSLIFDYGRHEVKSFLLSSAIFWLEAYHADALRVDAVASMLYLDYSRKAGEWAPNKHGGRENLEAISFLRELNEAVYSEHPDAHTIAEESTAWPLVSRPTYVGGLGFGYKWDMGWMHDTLEYFALDPIHRRFHHGKITFRMIYAFSENFVLPLSHDEVVHGKGSLLGKMAGDGSDKFANLRLLYGYMWGQPAKKLLFMGGEIGQWSEWDFGGSVDWDLLSYEPHQGLLAWVRDLNRVYRTEPALHQKDCDPAGFEWIDCNDSEQSAVSFLRHGEKGDDDVIVACNFTPVPRIGYAIGCPRGGTWNEILNSDAESYGGHGLGNLGKVKAEKLATHGRPFTLRLTLPPLSILYLKRDAASDPEEGIATLPEVPPA